MVNWGNGRTPEEARSFKNLGSSMADALADAAKRGGTPLRTITFVAPASGGHQTWTDAGVSECPDCLRKRICFRSPVERGLIAHFCLTCWELVIERAGERMAWSSRRLAKVLHDFPPGRPATSAPIAGTRIPFDPPVVTPLGKPS